MRARTRETSLAMPRRATPSPCALSTSGGSRMDASSSTGTNSIHSTSSSKSAQCRPLASRHDTAGPGSPQDEEQPPMPLDKLIAVGLPIALGVVMIGAGAVNFIGPRSIRDSFARWGYPPRFHRVTGGLEMTAGLLLIPATSRAGAIGSVMILLAAVIP